MKRNRIISLLIALTLALSLSVPALAAPAAEAPALSYDDYLADFDRWWAEDYFWGSVMTPEEYLTEIGDGYGSLEEFQTALYGDWLNDEGYQRWDVWFRETHTEEIAAFDPYAYWEEEGYGWFFDSAEDYMAELGLSPEEFTENMLADWLYWQWLDYSETLFEMWEAELAAQQRDARITQLGGVPGQLNVMLNGRFLSFPDAIPEAVDGRIMVPLRALMEALGAEVTYRTDDILCTLDGVSLIFALGNSEVTAEYPPAEDGCEAEGKIIEMDCAVYAHDGRTYVPVRFFAEALGLEVLWDEYYQSAVLTDPNAAISAIDGQFSILNRALAAQSGAPALPETGALRTEGNASLSLTMLDSLDGDEVTTVELDLDGLANAAHSSGSVSITLDDETLDRMLEDYPEEIDREALRDALSQIDLNFISDLAEGRIWYQFPLLARLAALENPEWNEASSDAWYTTVMEGLGAQEQAAALSPTVGSYIWSSQPADLYDGYFVSPVDRWQDLMDSADSLGLILGDEHFTRQDGKDVRTYDLAQYAQDFGDFSAADYKELSLELTVDEDGGAQFAFVIHSNSAYSILVRNYRAEASGSLSADSVTLDLDYHMSNTMKLTLHIDMTRTETDQLPQTAPPEGAEIIDLDDYQSEPLDPDFTLPGQPDPDDTAPPPGAQIEPPDELDPPEIMPAA